MQKKLLIILGPTATGKTDLALYLAKNFNGELVSCDSRQVYKNLDIGTGKSPGSGKWEVRHGIKKWEVGRVNIWMYDVVSPKRQYTVYSYVRDATRVIGEIRKRGKLPIIVGGTGLYLKALLYGLPNLAISVDKKLRRELNNLTVSQLQDRLKKISYPKWKSLNNSDRQNPRRLIRAIELEIGKGNKGKRGNQVLAKECNILKIGLTAPKSLLYKKADQRVVKRINQGMIEEANKLHKVGLTLKRMKQLGLEYGVLADYLSGKITPEVELIKIMQSKIHSYVRRQLTWFKKEKDVVWFDVSKKNFVSKVEKLVSGWYHS